MHNDNAQPRAVEVETIDRPFSIGVEDKPFLAALLDHQESVVQPLDNKDIWREAPAYSPPADIDIVREQKWIDSLMGTTRGNESIYKLVWNGDRNYWHRFYMVTNGLGRPIGDPERRPLIRFKALRDSNTRQLIRDVFPPRWLILTRLEPEQYAEGWKSESYINDGNVVGGKRQIRPDEPPPVFWLNHMTIARHSDFCCSTAYKNKEKCFGEYAPPSFARELLEIQHKADMDAGIRSVFEKIDAGFASEIDEENNGYKNEMAELETEREVYLANPMALLGIEASLKAGLNNEADARQFVKDYYDREAQAISKSY